MAPKLVSTSATQTYSPPSRNCLQDSYLFVFPSTGWINTTSRIKFHRSFVLSLITFSLRPSATR